MKTKTYYHYQDNSGNHYITHKEMEFSGKLLNKIEGIRTEEEISLNDKLEVNSVYSTTSGRKIKVISIL
jgi:hypothetical protein